MSEATEDLISELARATLGPDASSLPDIGRASAALQSLTRNPSPTSAMPDAVVAMVNELREVAVSPTTEDLRVAVLRAAPHLFWISSYLNHTEPDMVHLHANYFVAMIVGPEGAGRAPVWSDQASVYLTVQAANLYYPSHVHKAPELYHVIAGTGLWQMGGRDFIAQPPGSWIVHPTGTRHAMETEREPMLSLAIWTDDLDSIPVIVRD